jgi:hypothetical protein
VKVSTCSAGAVEAWHIAGFTAPQACNATFFAGMGSIVKRLTGPTFLQGQAL